MVEKKCPKPCHKMEIRIKSRGKTKFKAFVGSVVNLELNPSYEFKSKVLAYDGFDFVVDTGSSLGLWIGRVSTHIFNTIRIM
jgi:hypothetical protein